MNKVKFPSCNKVQRKQSKGMPFVVKPYYVGTIINSISMLKLSKRLLLAQCLPEEVNQVNQVGT